MTIDRHHAVRGVASAVVGLLASVASPSTARAQAARILHDIAPGDAGHAAFGGSAASHDGYVYFPASGAYWKTDGTTAGTTKVVTVTNASNIAALNGSIYYFDGALRRIDGTTSTLVTTSCDGCSPESAVVAGNALFFDGQEFPSTSWTVMRFDATDAGPTRVPGSFGKSSDAEPNPGPFIASNGAAYFLALKTRALYSSAGALTAVDGGSMPIGITEPVDVSGTVFFAADKALWKVSGTVAQMVKSFPTTDRPTILRAYKGQCFFMGHDDGGYELWRSDGTTAGTVRVKDVHPSGSAYPRDMVEMGGLLYFTADDGVHGRELWRTDGTEAGTALVKDVTPGPDPTFDSSSPRSDLRSLAAYRGAVVWARNHRVIWKSDGTEAGTTLVQDLTPVYATSFAFGVGINEHFVFAAYSPDHGHEPWVLDLAEFALPTSNDAGVTTDAGDAGARSGAGGPGGGGGAATPNEDDGSGSSDAGGCGCRVEDVARGGAGSSLAGLFAVALVARLRSRRRRPQT